MHPYSEFVNPHLGRLLSQLNMDKSFVKGEGPYLYDSDGNRYLDFIASYGALPFGYNPPEIWDAIAAVRATGEPSFCQPSALNAAGELARRLVELAPPGLRYVTFTNSGAEAVEASLKLARAVTGRRRILATFNSFHGKTLGALSATGRESYQKPFGAPVEGFHFIPYGDLDALKNALSSSGGREGYAAFIVEPIQGEGGIIVPPPGYLARAKEICAEHGVLLILDEIQTGLGRTGKMFACEEEGVFPDVMLLAKALGGGIVPIGACISAEEAYCEEFAMKHSSTFAANSLACRVGIATLDLLTRNDGELVRTVERNGAMLLEGLHELWRKYPGVLASVRGKGFMLGMEFVVAREAFPGSLLGVMAEQELLTPVISSYLLNTERLRVAPTLNGQSVIRIEPPLTVSWAQCEEALGALDRMLDSLSRGNTANFLRHLLGTSEKKVVSIYTRSEPAGRVEPSGDPEEGRFAFLVHPISLRNYAEFDESLSVFTEHELQELADRWNDMVEPFVVSSARVTSDCGKIAYGEFIGIPRTAEELLAMPREQALGEIRAAVDLARLRGARIVGLGAYTSVVSRGGLHLLDAGVPLTTGNSYTVVAAVAAVLSALERLGTSLQEAAAAVVGATGSIGRATSILLAEEVPVIILIGNPRRPEQSRRRLLKVAGEICRHLVGEMRAGRSFAKNSIAARLASLPAWPDRDAPLEEFVEIAMAMEGEGGPIIVSTDLEKMLPLADVVVTATSSVDSLVTPGNLKYGAVVCDLSRPPNVSPDVRDARPDVLAIDGGVIAVPGLPSLGWNFGFEKGLAYACMAETMMLALEGHYEHTSIGANLSLDTILYLRELADKHGFRLASLRSFNRPLEEAEWERLAGARAAAVGQGAG